MVDWIIIVLLVYAAIMLTQICLHLMRDTAKWDDQIKINANLSELGRNLLRSIDIMNKRPNDRSR